MLRITKENLKELGCGAGVWTMQGFECRNKQSRHVCDAKANGKVNCCRQALNGLHQKFLYS